MLFFGSRAVEAATLASSRAENADGWGGRRPRTLLWISSVAQEGQGQTFLILERNTPYARRSVGLCKRWTGRATVTGSFECILCRVLHIAPYRWKMCFKG